MDQLSSKPALILASASPRRRQLLAEAGIAFQVVIPPITEPEEDHAGLPPAQQAEALAYFKARAVAQMHPQAVVLAADTVVAGERGLLGKPTGRDDARRMLECLSGTRHQVITGVALIAPAGERLIASEITYVKMKPMSQDQIEAYLDTGEWQDKAGAYAIQETADRYIESVEGSFTNVVGLPMELVIRMLQQLRSAAGCGGTLP